MNNRAFWFRFCDKKSADDALKELKKIASEKDYLNYLDISDRACYFGKNSDGPDSYAWIERQWKASEILKLKVEKGWKYEWIINFPYPEERR